MADEQNEAIHHFISKTLAGNVLELVECRSTNCKECSTLKRGFYHCPLYPLALPRITYMILWTCIVEAVFVQVRAGFCPWKA